MYKLDKSHLFEKRLGYVWGKGVFTNIFSCIPFIIYTTFAAIWYHMWTLADEYNQYADDQAKKAAEENPELFTYEKPKHPYYDKCGSTFGPFAGDDDTSDYSTNWTIMMELNSYVYLGFSIVTIIQCLSWMTKWPNRTCGGEKWCCKYPLAVYGLGLVFLGHLANVGVVAMTGIFLFSPEGKACLDYSALIKDTEFAKFQYNEDGDTFNYVDQYYAVYGMFFA